MKFVNISNYSSLASFFNMLRLKNGINLQTGFHSVKYNPKNAVQAPYAKAVIVNADICSICFLPKTIVF